MTNKREYAEIEGIKCEVKNPRKKGVVKLYQDILRQEIDKYVGTNRMTDSKKAYADALEINIKIAPFVLGWLRKPDNEDEYRVIKGFMTIEELESKIKKNSTTTKKTAPKKTAPKTTRKKN